MAGLSLEMISNKTGIVLARGFTQLMAILNADVLDLFNGKLSAALQKIDDDYFNFGIWV